MYSNIELAAQNAALALQAKEFKLVTAESCTGGWVAQAMTAIPGSTAWFERGFVTYSNEAKQEMLNVQAETLAQWGAVSEQTAKEMAAGALLASHAQVSLAVTGIAGPSGGTVEKPVGFVCFAWQVESNSYSQHQHFEGDRTAIRRAAVGYALSVLTEMLG